MTSALVAGLVASACARDTIEIEGALGRPILLASGDGSALPRLLLRPGDCPGAPGPCTSVCAGPPASCPVDACLPVILDSLTPVTFLADEREGIAAERGCLEIRAAGGALADPLAADDLGATVTRFRFSDLALALVPHAGAGWDWRIGDERGATYVGGVLGGSLLRHLAVRLVDRPGASPTIALYREFPGSDASLADQGRAFIPVQFPGQLLGKEVNDVCLAGEDRCDFIDFHLDSDRVRNAIQPSQMVLDACLAPPPGSVFLATTPRRCAVAAGSALIGGVYTSPAGHAEVSCGPDPDREGRGGAAATLVVATGLPDLVLFADSARRFFGALSELPECAPGGLAGGPGVEASACRDAAPGALYPPGRAAAGVGDEPPLPRIRIRSLGLVPGLTNATGRSPCQRLEARLGALKAQCDGVIREGAPYPVEQTRCASAAEESAVLLGEVDLRRGLLGPDPSVWIPARILPETHPLALSVRRNVVPEALQPDGLLGSALLRQTDVILDYTDDNPGVRVACTVPGAPGCLALPSCARSSGAVRPSCCYGLPPALLVEMISDLGLYGCCSALSEGARRELNCKALAEGRDPPCPEVACVE